MEDHHGQSREPFYCAPLDLMFAIETLPNSSDFTACLWTPLDSLDSTEGGKGHSGFCTICLEWKLPRVAMKCINGIFDCLV